MDFDEDDWFFRSVKEYEDLFMYELQAPACCLEWINEKTVCVSCQMKTKDCTRSELQLLELPQKLTARCDQGLVKDRDFRVVGGGFYDGDISSIHHVQLESTNLLLTTENKHNKLTAWTLQDDSRVISSSASFKCCCYRSESAVAGVCTETSQVAFGSYGNNITVADFGCEITSSSACNVIDRLAGICWLDTRTIAFCGAMTGQVWARDLREKPEGTRTITAKSVGTGPWSMTQNVHTKDLILLNSSGDVFMVDVTREQHKIHRINPSCMDELAAPNIKVSPTDSRLFSVSASDSCVRIYGENSPEATFTHQGHLANTDQPGVKVRCHLWHPSIPCLLMSCAEDGSLHCWKYAS